MRQSVGVTTVTVRHSEPYAGKKFQQKPDHFEVVDFDQAQRDAIHEAIQHQRDWLKKHNAIDRLEKMREVYPDDVVDGFAGVNQAKINQLESVEKFFSAYRPFYG